MRVYPRSCSCGICKRCLNRRDAAKYYKLNRKRINESSRIYKLKKRYGGYTKKDYCEICRKHERDLTGRYRLLIHHVEWEDCKDCRRTGKGIAAKCKKHLITCCYPCHFEIHTQPIRGESKRDSNGRYTKRERIESSREDAYLTAKLY